MFGKNKNNSNKIIDEFNKYNSPKELEKYEELKNVYSKIRAYYEAKVINNEVDLKIEKIRLERNLGKQLGASITYIIAFGISILGALMSVLIQETLKIVNSHYWILTFLVIGALYFFIMRSIGNEAEKARPRDIMLNISLKVVEELEKEINENKAKQEREDNREKTIQRISQHIDNKNAIKNVVLPVIAEIAATTVVKKRIWSKLVESVKRK